jgi:hypothetical protein
MRGSVRADHVLTSRTEPGIALRGPSADDQSWQAPTGTGFAAAPCVIDWDATHAIGPHGQRRGVGMERPARHGQATAQITFSRPVCAGCSRRGDGTRSAPEPRTWRLREREPAAALQTARTATDRRLHAGVCPSRWRRRPHGARHAPRRFATLALHGVRAHPAQASARWRRAQLRAGCRLACRNTTRPDTALGMCGSCRRGDLLNTGLPATSGQGGTPHSCFMVCQWRKQQADL